ncbi:MAG: hypothetical protein ACKVQW_03920 [Pyrinomonadaceae bacterium]
MTKEKMAELLKLTLLSRYDDEINDQLVDQVLSKTEDAAADVVIRIQKRFIEKRIGQKITDPIKTVKSEYTFGDYIETIRASLELSAQDVATAIDEQPKTIEDLEKGRILPWACSTKLIGALMHLFKLHYDAAEKLINTSAVVLQAKGPIYASARSNRGKMTETRGNSTARALERFLAAKKKSEKPSEDVSHWLGELKGTLESEGWSELIQS